MTAERLTCDVGRMLRRLFAVFAALTALTAPAAAKDELVMAMTQSPGTLNPLISSMLAKSLIQNMRSRTTLIKIRSRLGSSAKLPYGLTAVLV